jgi:hypothetical protein
MERIVVHNTDDGCLGLQFAHGQKGTIRNATVTRSTVLSNLVSSAEEDEFVTIEVPTGYMGAWLEVVGGPQLDPSRIPDMNALIISIKVRLSARRFEACDWGDAAPCHVASRNVLFLYVATMRCIQRLSCANIHE